MEPKENIKLIADVAVLYDNEVLLVKYKNSNKYDHQTGWFLPDDVISYREDPVVAAQRILKEQLNIIGANVKLNHVESFSGNDKSWHLAFHFVLTLESIIPFEPSNDIETASWFLKDELPDEKEIAHHGWAKYTIEQIVNNK